MAEVYDSPADEAGPAAVPGRVRVRDLLLPSVVALVVLGPVLAPGALFNLDLIVVPRLDLPAGFWGLGPELPRRLPLWVPISWLSPVVPATVTAKALMFAVLVGSWVGMARFARSLGIRWVHATGALYALSPFMTTRSLVGHFMVTLPMALLPFVLPVLLKPGRSLRATMLAAAALSLGGHYGGSIAIVIVVVAVLCGARERWWQGIGVALAAQAAWLVPALCVGAASTARPASGDAFPTDSYGIGGLLRLSAGGGFWNTYYQVGGRLILTAVGALIVVLLWSGFRAWPSPSRRPMVTLGLLGWLLSAATSLWGLSTVFDWFVGTAVGAVWREGQRVLLLYVLWMAPAVVLGAQRWFDAAVRSRRWLPVAGAIAALPATLAALLTFNAIWGFGGRLSAEPIPSSWDRVRSTVRAQGGSVLALPWYQYYNQQLGDGPVRRVLNPMPLYLGSDVLSSSNNGLEAGVRERADPREEVATTALRDLVDDATPISGTMATLGVRWVVLQKTVHLEDYVALGDDPGLEVVVDAPEILLYRVRAWRGEAVTAGRPVTVPEFGPALATFDGADGQAVEWFRAGGGGWRRGWDAASTTATGTLRFPPGSGLVWNAATLPSLAAQAGELGVVAVLLVRRARNRPLASSDARRV